ncbi:TetR family transcriptional regulator [Duganella sp. FT80W]|uniref:TetR family transcriptional regulator n=1 Tax=Duganella guangzhouensis TaxID=2666084 RepID=A0A6I2L3K6_9BURK|nr:TetR/AcrR family transcriptional regulator [Duganella guangzhouensis]MRW92915.1 TetR family transcriptional regulator [Duganella guangzhouensis]
MGSTATKKASSRTTALAPVASTPRLAPEEREQIIVQKAIKYFAEHGFGASTRDLAKEIGVSQPLLYRYFPNKQALADRVFEEVYLSRWNPEWEEILADHKRPLTERLHQFYQAYSKVILQRDWIRIFIHAGLSREGINSRYLARLRERIFNVVLAELRREFKIPAPTPQQYEDEIEFVWGLHAAIFYVGMRKSVYGLPVPENTERLIAQKLDAFLASAPSVLKNIRKK